MEGAGITATGVSTDKLGTKIIQIGLAFAVGAGALASSSLLQNVSFWLAITVGLIAVIIGTGLLIRLLWSRASHGKISLLPYQQTALAVFSLMMVVVATEAFFGWRERAASAPKSQSTSSARDDVISENLALAERDRLPLSVEAAAAVAARRGALTMPEQWERRDVTIEGSILSYIWHNALHVHDENFFRRTTPFPPKRPGVFRLTVVGDSMTYGYGVDEKFSYVSLLQDLLGRDFNVEVLNLGRSGWQSEDILGIVRTQLPQLQPDLVFYGVVHNDFLPSQKGQYVARGYEFPIPESLETFLMSHSRFVGFVADAYDAALRTAGLRKDFFDDILEDFAGYQVRFAKDVAAMNQSVTGQGLPPIVTMVLDQYADYDGRGHKITRVAEGALAKAGMQVISIEDYYRRYDGRLFSVSPWEGHADEVAHAIFAAMIVPHLRAHPALQPYRKTSTDVVEAPR